ncbi:MAG: SDR family oxidoreductase [Ginsengibacter sp.]
MKKGFENKVAIVTGAGQGIGFEICRRLAQEGAKIILNDIEPAICNSAAEQITLENGICLPLAGDAGDPVFIDQLISTAVNKFGGLDIAIANAGITLFGDFYTYAPDVFSKVLQVNLAGTFFLAQAASKQMKNQGRGGSLLFTSSVTGHQAHKNLAVYGMTKAAIEMLAKNLVIEISSHKINVNCIAPGATLTERTLEEPGYAEVWSRLTPMGRAADVSDISAAALFLVSDEAKHITGQTLLVDGGWTSVSPSPY